MRRRTTCHAEITILTTAIAGAFTAFLAAAPIDQAQIIEFVLHPGEILFLPIGCLHWVEGLDLSVTVSFTNFVFDNDFTTFYTTYHGV